MRNKKKRGLRTIAGLLIITIGAFAVIKGGLLDSALPASAALRLYTLTHGTSREDYPEELLQLLENDSDAADFVLEYPQEKDCAHEINLEKFANCSSVPLFIQWDQSWGYESYNDNIIGLAGCGPTCLSMVAVYLTGDVSYDPLWMCNYSERNGYNVPGNGTAWSLFSEGAVKLGFDVTEIGPDEQRVADNLNAGNPVVCVMGPGDFTSTGHFIVLTGYKNGKVTVNDPNSKKRSEKSWTYSEIKNQIRDLWVIRKV